MNKPTRVMNKPMHAMHKPARREQTNARPEQADTRHEQTNAHHEQTNARHEQTNAHLHFSHTLRDEDITAYAQQIQVLPQYPKYKKSAKLPEKESWQKSRDQNLKLGNMTSQSSQNESSVQPGGTVHLTVSSNVFCTRNFKVQISAWKALSSALMAESPLQRPWPVVILFIMLVIGQSVSMEKTNCHKGFTWSITTIPFGHNVQTQNWYNFQVQQKIVFSHGLGFARQ